MTKDLALLLGKTSRSSYVTTEEFIEAVKNRLDKELKKFNEQKNSKAKL